MSHSAIRVDGLSKLYRVGARQQGYKTLRESISEAVWSPIERIRQSFQPRAESDGTGGRLQGENFWALKDVSFEVQPGEVVGIIGRNGAGKSTLLKVLSRITEPTSGRIELRGRIGSLLEVGTGFHPELSGRENIYMNGSILGMSRREIARKFDEIVDFSGIEDFLDTPVKRYSSGMYVRLAFAVAAHLEPEILIVDEVLAVGDAEFQRKCLGKMQDVAAHGRTVLFVSHNMAAVESLCQKVAYLSSGKVLSLGPTSDVVLEYRRSAFSGVQNIADAAFAKKSYIRNARLLDNAGQSTSFIRLGSEFRLEIHIDANTALRNPIIGIGIDAITGERMLTIHSPAASRNDVWELRGQSTINCSIPSFPLSPGEYTLKIVLSDGKQFIESVESAVPFTIDNAEVFGEGRGFHRGVCVAPSNWYTSR